MDTLAKNLCTSYILQIVTSSIGDLEAQMSADLLKKKFDMLDVLHHFTSGMKAYVTENIYVGIDEMR